MSQQPGDELQSLWMRRVEIEHTYRSALSELNGHPTETPFEPTEVAKRLLNDLVAQAERSFAPEGAVLKIDRKSVAERFLPDSHVLGRRYKGDWTVASASRLDLVGAWAWLTDHYGGQAGAQEAYRQAAERIISGFWLRGDQGVKRTSGALVLSARVWMDSLWDDKRLPHDCADRIRNLCLGLAAFARWAGRVDLGIRLDAVGERYCHHPRAVTSRERIAVASDLLLITYYQRFEFRFAGEIGRKLQLFIARYGELAQQVA